jgi:hypothetical protein
MPAAVRTLYRNGTAYNKAPDGRYYAISQYIQGEVVNPLLRLDLSKGNTVTDNILGNFHIELSPFKGVVYTSRVGLDYTHQLREFWSPKYYYSDTRGNGSTPGVTNNSFTESRWQWENFLTYNKSVGQNNFNVFAGMSAESLDHSIPNGIMDNMFADSDQFAELNNAAGDENGKGIVNGNLY